MTAGPGAGIAPDSWPEPTVQLASAGWLLRLPVGSMVLADPSSGPGTEQISLPGDILLTLIPDQRVRHLGQLLEWAQHQAGRFVTDRGGDPLAEGAVRLPGRDAYASLVGFDGHTGQRWIVAAVGLLRAGRFLGLLVLWPVVDPALEPDLSLVRRVAAAADVGEPDGADLPQTGANVRRGDEE